ncbi:MAG: hypothetical protein ACOC1V_04815 [Candidatus Saliniplasma sp.]
MISTTELKIFKALDRKNSMSELSEKSGLDISTVSKYISRSLEKGNGLFVREREGKKVYVKRADTSHSSILQTIVKEYPGWDIEELFSHSGLKILGVLFEPKRIKDIVFLTGLSRQYIRSRLKKFLDVGIVKRARSKYVLNGDLRTVSDFVKSYCVYINEKKAKGLAGDSNILWQMGFEFLFKTSEDIDVEGVKGTAVSRFFEYGLPIITDKNYYFVTHREPDVREVILHTILIDKNSVTYNTYACLLYQKEMPEEMMELVEVYGLKKHFQALKAFLDSRERKKEFLPSWEEYLEIAKDYDVIR